MTQFVPFEKGVEVNGQTILAVVYALHAGRDTRWGILEKHGLGNIQPDQWYSQEKWLNAFRDISKHLGDPTLFVIGKAIPENALFPPEIDSLEKALNSIDIAYHMNHRGGEIGSYKLTSFDAAKREAIMVCHNPYPSEFDRGIITTMLRKFKPKDSYIAEVNLDQTKETRQEGKETCTYIITW
ncbi:hypothetical protein [Xanthocytophaga agilis]|uniref:Uncharacterized protein n=1 Tax=Xanthocytophaga agilis TaxID=3048010 RepID=A0AAE3UID9_9BACT|nr:hypothetical protein [Xanthocytophaga agilis]MDJ1504362.1 hypothetical protein [Xanthocytophaga agilis]